MYSAVNASVQKETPANQKANSAPSVEVIQKTDNSSEVALICHYLPEVPLNKGTPAEFLEKRDNPAEVVPYALSVKPKTSKLLRIVLALITQRQQRQPHVEQASLRDNAAGLTWICAQTAP